MQYSHGRAGRGSILPCAEAGLAVRERSPLASVSCARRRGHRREASPCPQGAHSLTGAKRARKRGRARGCGQSRPAQDVQRHAAGCTCWLVQPTPEHPGRAPCEAPGTQRGRDTVSLSAVRAANKGKWKDIRRRLVCGSRGKWGVNAAPPRDALRADSKGAPLKPRPRAGKEPASHAPERAEKVLAEETVSTKAWWAEFEDQDGGRGLGLSRRDMGQQGAEERRQSRPRRALLASAQRPAVGGPCGATDGHETGG